MKKASSAARDGMNNLLVLSIQYWIVAPHLDLLADEKGKMSEP